MQLNDNLLDICVSLHFVQDWELVFTKYLKSIPHDLINLNLHVYIDISKICNNFLLVNEKLSNLKTILNRYKFIYYIHPTIGGLKNNMFYHTKTTKSKYSLLCEFDFIFTPLFANINFTKLSNVLFKYNIDFIMFEREKNQNYTPILFEEIFDDICLRKVNYYSNNNFIVKNETFNRMFSNIYKDNCQFSSETGSRGIETEFINSLGSESLSQYYYGKSESGPYIFHIDGSDNYLNFDMNFKLNDNEKIKCLTKHVNRHVEDIFYLNSSDNYLKEYAEKLCFYQNIILITTNMDNGSVLKL